MSSDKKSSKQSSDLDLGISELVKESDLQLDLRLAKLIARRTTRSDGLDDDDDQKLTPEQVVHCEFETLWKKGEYRQLAELAEQGLSVEDPEEAIRSKLWWVRAQSSLGEVPVSILSAPLEYAVDCFKGDLENSELQQLAGKLLVEVAGKLRALNEFQQSLEFYESAREFGERTDQEVKAVLLSIIDSLEEVPLYARSEEQQRELEAYKERVKEFKTGSYLDVVHHEGGVHQQEGSDLSHKRSQSKIPFTFPNFTLPQLTILLTVSTTLGVAYVSLSEALQPAHYAPELVVLGEHLNSQLSPQVEREESAVAISAIFSGLDSGSGLSVKASSSQAEQELPKVFENPKKKTLPAHSLETVDTQSPKEPRRVFDIITLGKQRPSKKPGQKVIDENFVRSFPGRSGTDGFAVYRYDPPRLYRVTRKTEFMTRPSERSRSLDTIDIDVTLVVEEDLGKWLKVRRKDGEIGYVNSQDTEYTGKTRE